MRAGADGDAVGADHGFVEGKDALDIVLVHLEVDRGARLQAARGFVLGHAPFPGDVVEIAARAFGVRFAGGDQHPAVEHAAVGADHGGAGRVRVAVERHALVLHGLADKGQGYLALAKIGLPLHLVVRQHHRHVELAADAEGLVERGHDVV
ncbi:hypothetical protein D3C72_1356240 [compost metagenome]